MNVHFSMPLIRAIELISAEQVRFVGIDGRLANLESDSQEHLLPLISDNWTLHFKWRGLGEFPVSERDKLKSNSASNDRWGEMHRFENMRRLAGSTRAGSQNER